MRTSHSMSSTFWRHVLFGCLAVALAAFPGGVIAQEEDSAGPNGADDESLPLPVDRWVPIDMTEGSWISLDEVHPRRRPLAPLWWWDDEPDGVPGSRRSERRYERDCPTGSGAL